MRKKELSRELVGHGRPVDEADDDAGDEPLEEICNRGNQGESQTDIQVGVVVQHEAAHDEEADEDAETSTFNQAGATLICHRVEDGKHHHGQEDGGHAHRHMAHLAVMVPVDGGEFEELSFE